MMMCKRIAAQKSNPLFYLSFTSSLELIALNVISHSIVSVSGFSNISDKNHDSIDEATVITPRIMYGSDGKTVEK